MEHSRQVTNEVLRERQRQREDHGYDPLWDDRRGGADYLAGLGAQYAVVGMAAGDRRKMVQAAALLIAAIEAMDRERNGS